MVRVIVVTRVGVGGNSLIMTQAAFCILSK